MRQQNLNKRLDVFSVKAILETWSYLIPQTFNRLLNLKMIQIRCYFVWPGSFSTNEKGTSTLRQVLNENGQAMSQLAPLFNCLIQSTNFGQPETWPVCRFRFCFLDIRIRTIQLKHEGWGAFIWTTASQDDFVGFNPLTILSGQGHISELIA